MKALTSLLLILVPAAVHPQTAPYTNQFFHVDDLPRLRSAVVTVGSFSSYDRTGGNDDGFAGTYSFLRKDPDSGLVIAELKGGPGALTRIWTTSIDPVNGIAPDTVDVYFDGEATPRIHMLFRDFFSGKVAPFVPPLADTGAGGYYSYVPLEFSQSIKVVIRAKRFHFYQINYVRYAPGTPVQTFQTDEQLTPPGLPTTDSSARVIHVEQPLAPGRTLTLFEGTRPGRILSLKIAANKAFIGPYRDIVLRMYWDGAKEPAVNVPLGDFFGYFFGHPSMRSLLIGSDSTTHYVNFPMPFARRARIELVSERTCGQAIPIQADLIVSNRGLEPGEGTFHAEWHREDPVPTGKPFIYLDVAGHGHLVGVTLQAQGDYPGFLPGFFEGDDGAVVDGDTAIHGTGSEDFFNGGWYDIANRWDRAHSFPLSGALGYDKRDNRTGGYRLFLSDAYAFRQHLVVTMEHGGAGNVDPGDYTGVAYFYLDRPSGTTTLPKSADRTMNELVHRTDACDKRWWP